LNLDVTDFLDLNPTAENIVVNGISLEKNWGKIWPRSSLIWNSRNFVTYKGL
jgi:hypothetical protein